MRYNSASRYELILRNIRGSFTILKCRVFEFLPKLSKEKRPKGRYELGRLYKSPRIRKIGEIGRKNIFLSEGRVMNLGNSNRVAYLLSVFQKL